jgi:hypothetical protein
MTKVPPVGAMLPDVATGDGFVVDRPEEGDCAKAGVEISKARITRRMTLPCEKPSQKDF